MIPAAHEARLGRLLVERFGVDAAVVARAEAECTADDGTARRLRDVLIDDCEVDATLVAQAVAAACDLPYLEAPEIDAELRAPVRALTLGALRNLRMVPLARHDTWLEVAVVDPYAIEGLEMLEAHFELPVRMVVVPPRALTDALNKVFQESENTAAEVIDELGDEFAIEDGDLGDAPADILDSTEEDAPIIRLVNRILFQAVRDRASDIHIEPMEDELVVRVRIDGVLYPILKPPKRLQPAITSRVKIMANMNIAEKRLPQDGRIRVRIAGRDIDIRASSLPTAHGERLVLRILDRSQVVLDLESLGIEPDSLGKWRKLIQRPYGIILVTGPTGSGKTTTLYASLSEINSPDKNILTIEDPVEYQLKGVGQMNVNAKIDLTFASGLRTILRQDPDVILIGEIRDLETAEIAVQASLTGHLVFSTLHTNDAPGALTRLVDMGVEPFLVASSLLAVSGQRLVRQICRNCAQPVVPADEALRELGIVRNQLPDGVVYEGKGCDHCYGTGYRGRVAINELMMISETVRQMIMQNKDSSTVRKAAVREGMRGLREDGAQKVIRGLTTIAEVLRVTQEETLDE